MPRGTTNFGGAALAYVAAVLVLILVGGAGALYLGRMDDERRQGRRTTEALDALATLRTDLLRTEDAERGFWLTHDPAFSNRAKESAARTRTAIEAARSLLALPAEQAELERIRSLSEPLLDPAGTALSLDQEDSIELACQAALGALVEAEGTARGKERALLSNTSEGVHWVGVLGIGLAFVLVTLGLGSALSHRLARDRARSEASRLQQEVELQKLRAEATQFQEIFLGILGHDLRTPLASISMGAAVLERHGLPDRQREVVQRIARAATRMSLMVEQLVDFARGRLGGGIPIDPRPVDLAQLTRRLVQELEQASPGRRLAMSVEGNAEGLWDPDRLSEVVANLIGNALQHGAPNTDVDVRIEGAESGVVLKVTNQGEPITDSIRSTLFEPFSRGPRGKRAGLGLGLYISRLVVTAHNGTINLESSKEDGTSFIVSLPRAAHATTPVPSPPM